MIGVCSNCSIDLNWSFSEKEKNKLHKTKHFQKLPISMFLKQKFSTIIISILMPYPLNRDTLLNDSSLKNYS